MVSHKTGVLPEASSLKTLHPGTATEASSSSGQHLVGGTQRLCAVWDLTGAIKRLAHRCILLALTLLHRQYSCSLKGNARIVGGAVQDFHTSIAGAMTDDEYVRELYSAMLEDAQQELQAGMQRAAQRCVKKAELKVSMCWHHPLVRTQLCITLAGEVCRSLKARSPSSRCAQQSETTQTTSCKRRLLPLGGAGPCNGRCCTPSL